MIFQINKNKSFQPTFLWFVLYFCLFFPFRLLIHFTLGPKHIGRSVAVWLKGITLSSPRSSSAAAFHYLCLNSCNTSSESSSLPSPAEAPISIKWNPLPLWFFFFGNFDLHFSNNKRCWASFHEFVQSVQFSHSVMSDSLRPHESQHARPPFVHHQLPEFTQTQIHRVRDAIQPRSSPSPPAPNPSQHQSFFQWVNSSHEVAKVLEFQL